MTGQCARPRFSITNNPKTSMSKFLRALLISAAATGAAALLLNAIDLESAGASSSDGPDFPGMDPDDLSEEDVDALMEELASQLKI